MCFFELPCERTKSKAKVPGRLALKFQAAYGTQHLRPKHHFLFHNAQQLAAGSLLLDCFVHERKHQMMKQARRQVNMKSKVGFLQPSLSFMFKGRDQSEEHAMLRGERHPKGAH